MQSKTLIGIVVGLFAGLILILLCGGGAMFWLLKKGTAQVAQQELTADQKVAWKKKCQEPHGEGLGPWFQVAACQGKDRSWRLYQAVGRNHYTWSTSLLGITSMSETNAKEVAKDAARKGDTIIAVVLDLYSQESPRIVEYCYYDGTDLFVSQQAPKPGLDAGIAAFLRSLRTSLAP